MDTTAAVPSEVVSSDALPTDRRETDAEAHSWHIGHIMPRDIALGHAMPIGIALTLLLATPCTAVRLWNSGV